MAEAKAYKMIPHCTKDTITYEMEELVMCKDCKRKNTTACIIYCIRANPRDDWFCADGERKEGR